MPLWLVQDGVVEHCTLLLRADDLGDQRGEIALILLCACSKNVSAEKDCGRSVLTTNVTNITHLIRGELLLLWQRVVQDGKLGCETEAVGPVVLLSGRQAAEGLKRMQQRPVSDCLRAVYNCMGTEFGADESWRSLAVELLQQRADSRDQAGSTHRGIREACPRSVLQKEQLVGALADLA